MKVISITNISVVALIVIVISGCTVVQAPALDPSLGIKAVCIEKNNSVVVPGFVDAVRLGFQNHGIETSVHEEGAVPSTCEFVLRYTANQAWSITALQMHYARLDMYQKSKLIAEAVFQIKTQIPFTARRDVSGKVLPLIDKLLANY